MSSVQDGRRPTRALPRRSSTALASVIACVAALGVAGCGAGSSADDGKVKVVASFYPLAYLAQRVGGDLVSVDNLTQPGVEPHDLELTARQTALLSNADLAVIESALQPAVERAVENNPPKQLLDATEAVDLREADGGPDPHFWLDPTLMAALADDLAEDLAEISPEHADAFAENNTALQAELSDLDADYRIGLSQCSVRTVVVSHDAFGYLGARYDLDVLAIAGISPDAEPSAKHLADLAELVGQRGVTTVFTERLASPELADTLAEETGLRTATLDPVEGPASKDHDADYLALMRANLEALRTAGNCT